MQTSTLESVTQIRGEILAMKSARDVAKAAGNWQAADYITQQMHAAQDSIERINAARGLAFWENSK